MILYFLLPIYLLFGSIIATVYEDLPSELKEKINNNLWFRNDFKNTGLVNKENFELVQRNYKWFTMTLPLQPELNRPPSDFYCKQLKNKKNLQIIVRSDHFIGSNSDTNSLPVSYFNCLTGIEKLNVLGTDKISSDHGHYFPKTFFPKLKQLEMKSGQLNLFNGIPRDLTSLKIRFIEKEELIEEYISDIKNSMKELDYFEFLTLEGTDYKSLLDEIVPILNAKKTFKRFFLKYSSNALPNEPFSLFERPETIKFSIDLVFDFRNYALFEGRSANFIHNFPEMIENLKITALSLRDANTFCNGLSKMKNLKTLNLHFDFPYDSFECIFGVLPDSLTHLNLYKAFDLSNFDITKLPSSLEKVELTNIEINIRNFISFAEKVEDFRIDGDLIDPQNLLHYHGSFKNLNVLRYEQKYLSEYTAPNHFLIHLYELLPNRMQDLKLELKLKENEADPTNFEQKILNGKKVFTGFVTLDIMSVEGETTYSALFSYERNKMAKLR